jgi:hypothetical protein
MRETAGIGKATPRQAAPPARLQEARKSWRAKRRNRVLPFHIASFSVQIQKNVSSVLWIRPKTRTLRDEKKRVEIFFPVYGANALEVYTNALLERARNACPRMRGLKGRRLAERACRACHAQSAIGAYFRQRPIEQQSCGEIRSAARSRQACARAPVAPRPQGYKRKRRWVQFA